MEYAFPPAPAGYNGLGGRLCDVLEFSLSGREDQVKLLFSRIVPLDGRSGFRAYRGLKSDVRLQRANGREQKSDSGAQRIEPTASAVEARTS